MVDMVYYRPPELYWVWLDEWDEPAAKRDRAEARRQLTVLRTHLNLLFKKRNEALLEYAAWDHGDDHEAELAEMALNEEDRELWALQQAIMRLDMIIRR